LRGRILWLASYPKSGSTWIRALLTNYRLDAETPADINQLDVHSIASSRARFDELVGVEASLLPSPVIDRLRPEVYRRLAVAAKGTRFIKVHDAWTQADDGAAMFPADVTLGVVYIVRNPLDMVASIANHYGVAAETVIERMNDPDHATSDTGTRLHRQLRQRLRCWSGHFRSWVDDSSLRVHVVRYEDLAANTATTFEQVVRFCGLDVGSTDDVRRRVDKAVAFSDFTELRRQERAAGFKERSAAASRFFRQGQVGSWRAELSEPLVRRLVDAHQPMMQRLKYLPANSVIPEQRVGLGSRRPEARP
jgi:hypothetical protein